jgi:acyl-CoA thioesterase-1
MILSALLWGCGGRDVPADEGTGSPLDGVDARASASTAEPRVGRQGSPEDRLRVVFLGTSLTAGLGLEDPAVESWAARVAERARDEGYPVALVNAGVSGDTSAGGLRRLDWLLREPVDVLVVELGANDGLRGLSLDELASNLREIIRRTREAWPGARIVLAGMEAPPNLGQEYVEGFRSVFLDVARTENTGRIPFLLEGVAAVPRLNQADGIHPTAAGHARMAETAWPAVEAALKAREDVGAAGPSPDGLSGRIDPESTNQEATWHS